CTGPRGGRSVGWRESKAHLRAVADHRPEASATAPVPRPAGFHQPRRSAARLASGRGWAASGCRGPAPAAPARARPGGVRAATPGPGTRVFADSRKEESAAARCGLGDSGRGSARATRRTRDADRRIPRAAADRRASRSAWTIRGYFFALTVVVGPV